MIECAGGLSFAKKTGSSVGVERHSWRQELQRNFAVEPRVFGDIHDTHAANTGVTDDPVVRDGGSNHCGAESVPAIPRTKKGPRFRGVNRSRPLRWLIGRGGVETLESAR